MSHGLVIASVDPGLLIAQEQHGGVIPVVLVAIVLVGGLAYVLYKGRKRKGSDRDPGSDRGPEA